MKWTVAQENRKSILRGLSYQAYLRPRPCLGLQPFLRAAVGCLRRLQRLFSLGQIYHFSLQGSRRQHRDDVVPHLGKAAVHVVAMRGVALTRAQLTGAKAPN